MTATTFNSERQARKEYSKLSQEEIGTHTLVQLRKMLSQCGVKNFDRDGVRVGVGSTRKAEAVKLLWDSLEDERVLSQVTTDLSEEQVVELKGIADSANDVTDTRLGDLAEKSWRDLRAYGVGLYDVENQTWRLPDCELNAIANTLALDLLSKKLAISTTLKYKTTVVKAMRQMLNKDSNNPYYESLSDTFRLFEKELCKALSHLSREKKQAAKKNLDARNNEVCLVKVDKLISWAVDTLENLKPDAPKQMWGKVAFALMLVTGRRQSEILSSAKFELTDKPNTVLFTGQLKTKGKNEQAEAGYEIPVIASPESVVKAMVFLEFRDKRAETPELAHKRFSRQIVDHIAPLQDLYEVVSTPDGVNDAKGSKLHSHLARQIYGQVMAKSRPSNMTPEAYIARILGHGQYDLSTVQSYTADIRVVD